MPVKHYNKSTKFHPELSVIHFKLTILPSLINYPHLSYFRQHISLGVLINYKEEEEEEDDDEEKEEEKEELELALTLIGIV